MTNELLSMIKLIMLHCSKLILTWKEFESGLNVRYLRLESIDNSQT